MTAECDQRGSIRCMVGVFWGNGSKSLPAEKKGSDFGNRPLDLRLEGRSECDCSRTGAKSAASFRKEAV